jgi:hypothetical protein
MTSGRSGVHRKDRMIPVGERALAWKGQVLEVTPATCNDLNVYENEELATGQTDH